MDEHKTYIVRKLSHGGRDRFYYAARCSCGHQAPFRVTETRAQFDAHRHELNPEVKALRSLPTWVN